MREEFSNVKFRPYNEMVWGFMLREMQHGIVLEKHLYGKEKNVDVVMVFEGRKININEDFEYCVKEARKYVPIEIPLYVDLNRNHIIE